MHFLKKIFLADDFGLELDVDGLGNSVSGDNSGWKGFTNSQHWDS